MANEVVTIPASITGKFNLALTEAKFQAVQDKINKLVYTEDNLEEISSALKSLREVGKAIDAVHKNGKAEAKAICDNWDLSKRIFIATLSEIEKVPQTKYAELCNAIEKRKQEAAIERQRVESIKAGIEAVALHFANKIASCLTSVELTNIERLINLEKGRKEKYQEFTNDAANRFTELNSLLATQKVEVKKLEEIKRQEEEAKAKGDEEEQIRLQLAREESENTIEEAKINVQEKAIEQASTPSTIPYAEEVIPTVKARRSVWEWEVKDIKETAKKMPDWTTITPIESKIDEYLKAKKAEGIVGEEFTVAGIRFFLKKTF